MNDARPPLRAVFLDIGDTVMRPNPSWEHVYAMAFEEFGVHVDIDDLHTALRRAYHHGGWGMDGGFEPSEETSFRRTVEDRRRGDRRARDGSDAGCLLSAPVRAVHGHQPLAHLSLCVPGARGAATAWADRRSRQQLGLEPPRAAPRARSRPALRRHRGQRPHRLREAAPAHLRMGPGGDGGRGPRRSCTSATTSTPMSRARWRSGSNRC